MIPPGLLLAALIHPGCDTPEPPIPPPAIEPIEVARPDPVPGARSARLVSEDAPPSAPGARVPPPALHRVDPVQDQVVGEGWASPDGSRAAVVSLDAAGAPVLVLLEATGEEAGVLPFPGYPDGGWASPRWSPSGRFLALSSFREDRVDVSVLDVSERATRPVAEGARSLAWAPAEDVLVIDVWPAPGDDATAPAFWLYLPERDLRVSPLPDTPDDAGNAFVGFTPDGGVRWREYRRGRTEDGLAWNPVGERYGVFTADRTRLVRP